MSAPLWKGCGFLFQIEGICYEDKAEIKRKEDIETFLEKVSDLNEKLPNIIEGLNSKISEISGWYSSQMEHVNGDFSKLQKGLEEEHLSFLGNLKSQFSDKKSYIENYVQNLAKYQRNVERFSTDISKNFTNIIKNMEFEPFYEILSSYYSQINEIQHSIDFLKEDMIKLVKIKPNRRSIEDYRKNYRSLYRDKHIFLSLCDLKKYANGEEEATDLMSRNMKSRSGVSTEGIMTKTKRNKYSFPDVKSENMPLSSSIKEEVGQENPPGNNEISKAPQENLGRTQTKNQTSIPTGPVQVMFSSNDLYMPHVSTGKQQGGPENQERKKGRHSKHPSKDKEPPFVNNKTSFATTASTTNNSKEKPVLVLGNSVKLSNTSSTPATTSSKAFVQLNNNHSNENLPRRVDGLNANKPKRLNEAMEAQDESNNCRKNYFKFDDDLKREAQRLIETVDIFVGLENDFGGTDRGMLVGEGMELESEPMEPKGDAQNDLIEMDTEKVVIVSIKETLDEEEEKQKGTPSELGGEGGTSSFKGRNTAKAESVPTQPDNFEGFMRPELEPNEQFCQPTEISPRVLDNPLYGASNTSGSMNFRRKSRERKDNPFVAATNVTPVNFLPNKPTMNPQPQATHISSLSIIQGRAGGSTRALSNASNPGQKGAMAESKSKEKIKRPESPMQGISKRQVKKAEETLKNESIVNMKKQMKQGTKGTLTQSKALDASVNQPVGKSSSIYTSILTNHKTGGLIGSRHAKAIQAFPMMSGGNSNNISGVGAIGGNQKEEKDASPSLPVVTSGSNPSAKPLFFQARTNKSGGFTMMQPIQQGFSGSNGLMGTGANPSNLELYKKLQLKQIQSSGPTWPANNPGELKK